MKVNRNDVYDKYNGKCAYCGKEISIKNMQVDHMIPQYWLECDKTIEHKDVYCFENLMPSCRSCNNFKKTFDIETFRSEIEAQPERLRKYKPTFSLAERFGLLSVYIKPVVFYFEMKRDA